MTAEIVGTITRYCNCGDCDEIEVTQDDVIQGFVRHECSRTGGWVEVNLDYDTLYELGVPQLIGAQDVNPLHEEEDSEPEDLDDCPYCGAPGLEILDAARCMDTGAILGYARCIFCKKTVGVE